MTTPSTTIISCNSPNNVSDEMDIITFYNELSFLVQHIPKYNVLIIREHMNDQISKDETNKSCLRNSSNRNVEYLTNFSLKNIILNSKNWRKN